MQVYVEVSSYANLKCVRVLRCIIPGARHLLQFTRVLFRNAGVDMSASRVVFFRSILQTTGRYGRSISEAKYFGERCPVLNATRSLGL